LLICKYVQIRKEDGKVKRLFFGGDSDVCEWCMMGVAAVSMIDGAAYSCTV
jgi:hypothetical protein